MNVFEEILQGVPVCHVLDAGGNGLGGYATTNALVAANHTVDIVEIDTARFKASKTKHPGRKVFKGDFYAYRFYRPYGMVVVDFEILLMAENMSKIQERAYGLLTKRGYLFTYVHELYNHENGDFELVRRENRMNNFDWILLQKR